MDAKNNLSRSSASDDGDEPSTANSDERSQSGLKDILGMTDEKARTAVSTALQASNVVKNENATEDHEEKAAETEQ